MGDVYFSSWWSTGFECFFKVHVRARFPLSLDFLGIAFACVILMPHLLQKDSLKKLVKRKLNSKVVLLSIKLFPC